MKSIRIIVALLGLISYTVSAQQSQTYRKPIEDQYVPKKVLANFKTQYPKAVFSLWYTSHITYWYEDYATGWYGDWYVSRPIVVYTFEFPSYYEVDFIRNNESSRAIYNRYGNWFETRIKVKELPESISKALKEDGYDEWTWSDHKEKIQAPGMIGSVYRLHVTKGHDSRIVRISEEAEIVQIRYD